MASYAAAIDSLFPAPKGRRARRRAGIKNSKNNKNKKANRKSNKASSSTSSGNGAAMAKADAPTTARKVKLRPAEDVLSRIRHDPDLDEGALLCDVVGGGRMVACVVACSVVGWLLDLASGAVDRLGSSVGCLIWLRGPSIALGAWFFLLFLPTSPPPPPPPVTPLPPPHPHSLFPAHHHPALPHAEEFLICYEDRFLTELQEMTLAAWDEGLDECVGGIPLHRVRQFKHFDTVVWDRTSRLDLIFHSGNSAAAAAAASAVTLAASASEAA